MVQRLKLCQGIRRTRQGQKHGVSLRPRSSAHTTDAGLAHTHKGSFLVSHISVPDEHLGPVDLARLDPVDLQCIYSG